MLNKDKNYLILIVAHVLFGVLAFYVPFFSKLLSFLIIFSSLIILIKSQNKNNEVLYICAYIVGSEVFLRMTNGNPNHEFAKYSVMFFVFLGYIYSGFSKFSLPFILFIIVLMPSIFVANETLDYGSDIRKKILFNLSGELCLAFSAMYTFGKKITINQIGTILLVMGLPSISIAIYTQLYTPNIKEVLTSTASNSELSGGFGPNQVATILGLAMFIFFTRIVLYSRTKFIFILNVIVAIYVSYRGLLTFSRGGMITGLLMILIFLFFIYINSKGKGKLKLSYFVLIFSVLILAIWTYTTVVTGGLIEKRYTGKNALGVEKEDKFSGRSEIAQQEIDWFLENPFFGIGVGKGTDYRTEQYGYVYASHDEITRLLAEHGIFGIIALLILFATPVLYYMGNKQNIFLFCFVVFWILTINHSAMRTATAAFVYALALLKINFDDE